MEEQLKLSFTFEEEDFKKFQAYYGRLWTILLRTIILSVVFWVMFLILKDTANDQFGIIFIIGGWIWLILQPLYWEKKQVTKTNKSLFIPIEYVYIINTIGMTINSKNEFGSSSSIIPWNKCFKIIETIDAFYIYLTENSPIILPKRCFTNEQEISLFQEICIKNIEPKKMISYKKSKYNPKYNKTLDIIFRILIFIALVLYMKGDVIFNTYFS